MNKAQTDDSQSYCAASKCTPTSIDLRNSDCHNWDGCTGAAAGTHVIAPNQLPTATPIPARAPAAL